VNMKRSSIRAVAFVLAIPVMVWDSARFYWAAWKRPWESKDEWARRMMKLAAAMKEARA